MIILGLDPAIRTSGYGVIEVNDETREMKILDCGVILNKNSMPHSECLRRIAGGVAELIAAYKIDAAAIEEPFVGRNSKTAIILGMARGAFMAKLAENNIPIYSYSAKSAKKAAVGSGSAEKNQVALMMAAMLQIDIANILLDSTDALAIAMCHAQKVSNKETAEFLTHRI
ncbi:MAG: crossover junction endodeoxyribonuclease RuvC [Lentisphaeria bacterium]|nr:crossover junction endodeoxyribonuclease RuvC [Lentisphaeria bacterium]